MNSFWGNSYTKKYFVHKLLNVLNKQKQKTKNKKDLQRIRLCYKILSKNINENIYDIQDLGDIDKYLMELNNKKINKQKYVELFAKILAQYILYGQE